MPINAYGDEISEDHLSKVYLVSEDQRLDVDEGPDSDARGPDTDDGTKLMEGME